jgi:hypothetical protein
MGVVNRGLALERLQVPVLIFHTNLLVEPHYIVMVMAPGFEHDRAAFGVLDQAQLVLNAEVIRPVLPIMVALEGHGHAIVGGVEKADQGAGVAG